MRDGAPAIDPTQSLQVSLAHITTSAGAVLEYNASAANVSMPSWCSTVAGPINAEPIIGNCMRRLGRLIGCSGAVAEWMRQSQKEEFLPTFWNAQSHRKSSLVRWAAAQAREPLFHRPARPCEQARLGRERRLAFGLLRSQGSEKVIEPRRSESLGEHGAWMH